MRKPMKRTRGAFLLEAGTLAAATSILRSFQPSPALAAAPPPPGGKKRILAVAVGFPEPPNPPVYLERGVDENSTNKELRQIIRSLGRNLQKRLDRFEKPPFTSTVDFLVAPPDDPVDLSIAPMTKGIKDNWGSPEPDLILTVATAPTRTAKRARTELGKNTPIVFTVVSDPVTEQFVQDEARPGNGVGITGVSSNHIKIAGDGARMFQKDGG